MTIRFVVTAEGAVYSCEVTALDLTKDEKDTLCTAAGSRRYAPGSPGDVTIEFMTPSLR